MSGTEVQTIITARRKQRGLDVLASPGQFKVCEGCSSLCYLSHNKCPFCHAYRFDEGREAVEAMARLLGDRPLAVGCAILPRFEVPGAASFA